MAAMARTVKRDLDTIALLERCEKGDREAAYDLARVLRPRSVSELVDFVFPTVPPRMDMFDVLADAYQAYKET